MQLSYRESQAFAAWVYAILWLSAAAVLIMGVAIPAFDESVSRAMTYWLCGPTVLVMAMVTSILWLTVEVRRDEVYVRLGALFPVAWKHIPLADITECRGIQYRPIADAGGWGMRFGRFEGQRVRFYNARGNEGVLLVTAKRRYIIGSQQPEKLRAAIEDAQRTHAKHGG